MTVPDSVARLRGVQATGRVMQRAAEAAGRNVRLRVIVLFAAVEALANADAGTVGSVAPQLEHSLGVSTGQIGIIAGVAALAGALGTIPAGMLTDRINRVRLLAVSIVLWCLAQMASAFATSFLVLVLTRVALGAVTATAGPTIASLTGDFFPARERARVWGLILTGELFGSGVGVVASGNLASALSWRYGFGWLALPGLLLALGVWRLLAEPSRGGRSRLEPGATAFVTAPETAAGEDSAAALVEEEQELARDVVRQHHELPHEELVLHEDPVDMPVWRAVRYVLQVRTNRVLILASALGYMFFAGVQTFAVVLLRSRFGLSEGSATTLLLVIGIGALVGVVVAGQLADRLLSRGHESARVLVPAVCYVAAAAVFLPALLTPVLIIALPLFVIAGGLLAAPDPPINAARLDIMHPRLWGRAEAVRTFLFMTAFAVGPLVFGFLSQALGGPGTGAANSSGAVRQTSAMAYAFLIMLVPLAISGLILLRARRTYPRDVATAAASLESTAQAAEGRG